MADSESGGDSPERISKRGFLKAAVAIGGAASVAAVSASTVQSPRSPRDYPPGTFERVDGAQRQHAWDEFLRSDEYGVRTLPEHHLMLHLDYAGDGTPDDDERQGLADTLETFERALEWSNEGLLFTVSYSTAYFDRYERSLPEAVDLRAPQDVIDEVDIARDREAATADAADVHVHLASDHPRAVLEAEQALLGSGDAVNGVDVETDLDGVFEVSDRRTGFADQRFGNVRESGWGKSKAHNRYEADVPGDNPVPRDAPRFLGFKTAFRDNLPHQDYVTFTDGDNPFSGGTILQASLLRQDVTGWYEDHDHQGRVDRTYSPHHGAKETGPHGRRLGPRSGTEAEPMVSLAEGVRQDAEDDGVVGHFQKLARARDPAPPLLRRDVCSTQDDKPHTQFLSLQASTADFVRARKLVSFLDPDSEEDAADELPLADHGLLDYVETRSRGLYLMPPRRHRSFPTPRPG